MQVDSIESSPISTRQSFQYFAFALHEKVSANQRTTISSVKSQPPDRPFESAR